MYIHIYTYYIYTYNIHQKSKLDMSTTLHGHPEEHAQLQKSGSALRILVPSSKVSWDGQRAQWPKVLLLVAVALR